MQMEMEMQTQQVPPPDKWEYIENRTAMIRATPQIELRPHWYGAHDAEEIRAVVRRGVNAVNSHDALVKVAELVTLAPLQHGIRIPEELMLAAEQALAAAKE